jgi:hypothetical protein
MFYLYDARTKELLGSSTLPIQTSLIRYTEKAPTEKPRRYQVLVFNEEKQEWEVKEDFRGIWYHKHTKQKLVIKQIGVKVDLNLYTAKPPKPFSIWNETKQTWEFSLELYKQHKLKELDSQYQNYLASKVPLLHQIGYVVLIVRCLVLLITNKNLTDQQLEQLSSFIEKADQLFLKVNKVIEYYLHICKQLNECKSKEEVDKLINSINFHQFDKDLSNIEPPAIFLTSVANLKLY